MEDTTDSSPNFSVDFRGVKCPLNFVKTRLALEKIPLGNILIVTIDPDSDSAINVPNSLQQEGHTVIEQHTTTEALILHVRRNK